MPQRGEFAQSDWISELKAESRLRLKKTRSKAAPLIMAVYCRVVVSACQRLGQP